MAKAHISKRPKRHKKDAKPSNSRPKFSGGGASSKTMPVSAGHLPKGPTVHPHRGKTKKPRRAR
jgi:hypothetical protein